MKSESIKDARNRRLGCYGRPEISGKNGNDYALFDYQADQQAQSADVTELYSSLAPLAFSRCYLSWVANLVIAIIVKAFAYDRYRH